MLLRTVAASLFVAFLLTVRLEAQGLGGGVLGIKENLDLPFDALGENEEEEDAPEIVTFYGQNLEGDGFFYVTDKSGSMQDGELPIAKREMVRNITEFSEKVRFGLFFFDKALSKFPSSGQAAEANPGMKSSAISYVQSIPGGSGSCPQIGLTAALQMANSCSAKRKVIVYLGDGGGTCPGSSGEGEYHRQTLAAVAAQNWQRIQINAIAVLQPNASAEQFLRNLAAQNGGTYTRITR
ncbi:MAG: VWA domain-containing protein [Planctomycetes bacterium]|nr:VWA domain-containing protein [Planctomycetota bacterium]